MGHLTGAAVTRLLKSIEIVSDDSQRVLRVQPRDGGGVLFSIRDATDSQWSYKDFAVLDPQSAKVVAAVLSGGGDLAYSYGIDETVANVPTNPHVLPKPEEAKAEGEGDCTPLDIERAKAANLQEAKQLVQLEMERDHSLDRHVTGDVPGCPACDRKVIPSAWPPASLETPDLNDPEPTYGAPSADDGDDVPF
jgi:hypothetical protein